MKKLPFLYRRRLERANSPLSRQSFASRFITWCLLGNFLGYTILPSYANIIADTHAPTNQRPVILSDNQGRPLINIQTPNDNGLSHNRYTQFDVNAKGATLNNQRGSNPYLAKGSAKVILNEVRSNSPTQLNGTLNVQGTKADVIIANPSGIVVNGGGIQNASRAVLTTGQPQIQRNELAALNVQKGKVVIGKNGMDNRQTDYTEILSRAVEVQGDLQARQLAVSTGRQMLDYETGEAVEQPISNYLLSDNYRSTPEVGIDVAKLGGIYADSIYLVANENGAGVRNLGTLKATHHLVVTSSGKIENQGDMVSQNSVAHRQATLNLETLNRQDIVSNAGKIEAKTRVTLNSDRNVTLKNTQIKQTDNSSGMGVFIAAKEHIDTTTTQLSTQKGNLALSAKNNVTLGTSSELVSADDIQLQSQYGKVKLETETTTLNNNTPLQPLVSLKANNIHVVSPAIEINGAALNAQETISLASNQHSLSIQGILNKFSDYKTNKKYSYEEKLRAINQQLNDLENDPDYDKAKWLAFGLDEFLTHCDCYNIDLSIDYTIEEDPQEIEEAYRKIEQTERKIEKVKKEKSTLEKTVSLLNQNTRGHEYRLSTLSAKHINLVSKQGINIEGAKLTADQEVNIYAAGLLPQIEDTPPTSININGVFDTYEAGGGDQYSYAILNNPSQISGQLGVNIYTAAPTGILNIGASHLLAEQGKVNLYANDDIHLSSGQGELYSYHKYSYKTGKWYKRKYVTDIKEDRHAKAEPTIIRAGKGIDLHTGHNLNAYATVFDAPNDTINLTAGQALRLYAVDEIKYNKLESHKRSKFLGITYNKSNHSSTQVMKSALPARLVAQRTNLRSGWETLLQGTQFENSLTGANIQVGVGDKARKDAKLILQGIKSTIQNEERRQSNALVWQKMAGRGELSENLTLPSFAGVQPIFNAPNGIIVDVPKGKLKTELEALIKKPEYRYLKQLKSDANVNWNEVALAYDKWDYKQEGLTGAGAALIAIAVAVATYGTGATLAGSITGTTLAQGGTAAAMANAAFSSLASQASIAVVNNKGDVGKALKDLGHSSTVKQLATSVVTAGVASQLLGTLGLAHVTEASPFIDRLSVSLVNAGTAALTNSAINGESLSRGLETAIIAALAQTLQGELSQHIKGITAGNEQGWYRQVAHKLAHAVAGCAAASTQRGKCGDGAMGAAVGEIVGEILLDGRPPQQLTFQERQTIVDKTKLIVGSIAALTDRDVNTAVNSAEIAVKNNAIWFIPVLLAAYVTLSGKGNPLDGFEVIGRGEDPLGRVLSSATNATVELAMAMAPEMTTLVFQALGEVGEVTGIVVSYVDDITGNIVSRQWSSLDKSTQDRLLGLGKIATIALPSATLVKAKEVLNQPKYVPNIDKIVKQMTYRQNLINGLREQINAPGFKAKNLVLDLNNKQYLPDRELSKRAAVYSGVSDKEIFQLFQDLAGISKMPEVRIMENWRALDGSVGKLYAVKTPSGHSISLRNYSDTASQSLAKWTIDIKNTQKVLIENRVFKQDLELKFQLR
ncbi:filamentous hemagglutinin family protein [Nicoletella semolina]|uniref:Filamentous hemagglutinin family protein n=1 Tax=Nicoletella semolina TaxID=271160 RepID=A0A4R2NBL7_9PAST|nr:DUF637 domain-containing protein [Nicoletella semolina]MDH2925011.1 hypothetical protein [Nicoletella semolina]TCP18559.1 filamentous hemagglutinin family protein [Nicoletella semolina]